MTFDPNVPNAGQSPGLFPAQMNADLARLKTIINADHVFNDTAQPNDGVHKQMTMVARADPTVLPAGTNGVLYEKLVGAVGQLFFWNGVTYQQLTPADLLYPIRVVGSASVVNNGFQVIYPDPGFSYSGSAFVGQLNGTIFNNITPVHWAGGVNSGEEINHGSAGDNRLPMTFSGNNLRVQNKIGSTQTLVWSLILNRLS